MTPGFGPKMKASNGTPLNNKGDDKEGYNPGGTRLSSFGGGSTKINTYDSDKAQLAKPLSRELFSRGYNVIKNKAAQGRMDAYNKSNPVTPPASTSSGRGGTYGNIDTPKTVTPRSGREGGNGSSTPVTPTVVQPKKKTSFKSAYDKRDKKVYGNLSQSQFTAESKRQIASKKAGKGYDAPKKQMGKTPVVKPVKTQKGGTGFMGGGKNKKTLSPVDPKANLPQKDTTKTVKSKTVATAPKETSKRASKLRAKGNAQLAAGDNKGALATRRKYDKKNKKVAKKTKKGTNRVEYDESTGKGGSVLGNALRTVTGKRKRDKAAAEKRKNKKTVKATKPVVKAEKKEVVKKKKNERFMF